jgi:predicted RNA methylase
MAHGVDPRSPVKISPQVGAVLSVLEISRTQAVIAGGQLDRKLYLEVNTVLEALGGKWTRKVKAHVFAEDPTELLSAAIEAGEVISSVKALAFYATPAKLASDVVFSAGIREGTRVLEPSAGEGALAVEARFKGGAVTCVEIDSKRAQALRSRAFAVHEGDFLETKAIGLFDRVVMNPPFAMKGRPRADLDHVLHALDHLAPGGRLVAIMSAGVAYRTDKRSCDFRNTVARHDGEIVSLPDDSFKESGTSVRTVIVTLNKPGGAP